MMGKRVEEYKKRYQRTEKMTDITFFLLPTKCFKLSCCKKGEIFINTIFIKSGIHAIHELLSFESYKSSTWARQRDCQQVQTEYSKLCVEKSKCQYYTSVILTVIVIIVPTRGLLVVKTQDSFILWLAKYQKTCLYQAIRELKLYIQ